MGLKLGSMTFGSLFKKPETTLYPFEKKEPPAGLKGMVENDPALCILCGICEKRCPTGAIVVAKADRTWAINRLRCVQCQSCILACPKASLYMNPQPPAITTTIEPVVVEVPEQPKKAKVAEPAE
ncbi:MAG: 4Fe-4S dicluster domain-containing protein [Coriobacteriia bacterium]|nr:4Fe-4S dicluster domain-containing protein [Coriobacteriia bacterium]